MRRLSIQGLEPPLECQVAYHPHAFAFNTRSCSRVTKSRIVFTRVLFSRYSDSCTTRRDGEKGTLRQAPARSNR